MKSINLVRYGKADTAFELKESPVPQPDAGQILIKVSGFGLNYADVMARNGLYRDAPSLPCILGYEVVGTVEAIGKSVQTITVGQRVLAFTRFGGYAEYAVAKEFAAVPIPVEMETGVAVSLATQYCTAYFSACEMVRLHPGDQVLVHAAAGGVGIALVQLVKLKGCIVYGTAGSEEKMKFLKSLGVDYPINYLKSDFAGEIRKIQSELPAFHKRAGMDVIFDSLGGTVFSKSRKLLAYGGRIVSYGASERSGKGNGILPTLKLLLSFGVIHPVSLLMSSRGVIGVNMLRITDHKPEISRRCMEKVLELAVKGLIKPHVGGRFKAGDIAKAHELLEGRKSIGKIVVEW